MIEEQLIERTIIEEQAGDVRRCVVVKRPGH